MTSLIVSPSTLAELDLLTALLAKMNIAAKPLTDEDKEDLGLSMLIWQAADDPEVPRAEIMRKLGQE